MVVYRTDKTALAMANALSRRSVIPIAAVIVVASYTALVMLLRETLSLEDAVIPEMPFLQKELEITSREGIAPREPAALPRPQRGVTVPPRVMRRRQQDELLKRCFEERDYGMIPLMRTSNYTFCNNATGVDPALGPLSTYTFYYSPSTDIRSTVVTNLWVDLRRAQVFKQIHNISQDGHLHDPRFKHSSVQTYCVCNVKQEHKLYGGMSAWESIYGDHPSVGCEKWRFCKRFPNAHELQGLASGVSKYPWNATLVKGKTHAEITGLTPPRPDGWPYKVHHVKTNAIIVARRDDHNPFFQISVALNAWIMMKVLHWTPETTQLVYFDDGLPTLTDALQRELLAPLHPVVLGRDIMGSVLRFDRAMIAPFEYSGPLMRSLDSNEPCRRNALIQDFRDHTLARFKVSFRKKDLASCTITVISRRPYDGRMVQRKWINEDTIVERMRDEYERTEDLYKYGTCRIQSLDFVDLPLEQQMKVVVESDIVIGMHGAGMANVLWARPETVVAEIFPKKRKRWGYRNMCYFTGCQWAEFRGGKDTGTGDNASDKLISYAEWFAFFDPLVKKAVAKLEARVASSISIMQ